MIFLIINLILMEALNIQNYTAFGQNIFSTTIRGIQTKFQITEDGKIKINYSNIVNFGLFPDNPDSHRFSQFIRSQNFIRHIIYFLNIHNINHDLTINQPFQNTKDLINRTNGLFYRLRGEHQGTYGPYEFIDTILVIFDPEYASMVHQIMNRIDINGRLHNQNFEDEFNETMYKLELAENIISNYEIDYQKIQEYKQIEEDIENYEYEFNPNINLILKSRIDQLQIIQRDLRIYSAYSHYIERRNQTKYQQLITPKWKDLILILDPLFNLEQLNNLTNRDAKNIVYDLASKNNNEIETFINNDILRIRNILN